VQQLLHNWNRIFPEGFPAKGFRVRSSSMEVGAEARCLLSNHAQEEVFIPHWPEGRGEVQGGGQAAHESR